MLSRWKIKHENDAGEPPAPPDFEQMAKEAGVKFEKTDWLSKVDASDKDRTDLEKSIIDRSGKRFAFPVVAFDQSLMSYQADESKANDDESRFLWWRVDWKDSYVPTLDEVRSQVVYAWKMVEARKLAEAKAKEYAAEVNRRKVTLKEAFGLKHNLTVTKNIGPFTWLTQLNVAREGTDERQMMTKLTDLKDLDHAGVEFMRTVFDLEPGSAGVVLNDPKTIAYVVQVQGDGFLPPETVFRQQFLRTMAETWSDRYKLAAIAASQYAQPTHYAKLKEVEHELGFEQVAKENAPVAAPQDTSSDDD